MKFLIHSNAPTVATGYGVQTRHLADALASAGHQVAVSCTFGHQAGVGTWLSPSGHEIRLYPSGYITNSPDIIHAHAEHWFEGDKTAGWIIPLLDVWCLASHPLLSEFQVLAWTPVDHFPVPPDVRKFFHNSNAIPVAMSRFGERLLGEAGLAPAYVPLSVDTSVYKPTFTLEVGADLVTARQLFRVPDEAFVVGMVAMNKDGRDRKGFNEAFRAFGEFWRHHNEARLLVHTEQSGVIGGLNLATLATHCAIPPHAIIWTDQYAYRIGLPADMMAAFYTACDVLLSPSRGEGFCVPLIEAQACGTPVIASDFSAQTELVGAGWLVKGQPDWDQSQESSYVVAFVHEVYARLEEAHASDLEAMQADAVEFAAQYDTERVFAEHWVPLLDSLLPPERVEQPAMERVDIIVPLMRPDNMDRLNRSILATSPSNRVGVIVVHDGLNVSGYPVTSVDTRQDITSYAEKVNLGVAKSTADWVLVVGDDVEFTPGWFDAAWQLSTRFDVIGTNDSEEGRVRNPDVAAGRHADHFLIRRSYIEDVGASLDGPGVAMPTAYRHWYVDREVIQLARARGVFGFAETCRIVHHHPGYDGDEQARQSDPVYMAAVDASEQDAKTFRKRAPLIEAHRVTR